MANDSQYYRDLQPTEVTVAELDGVLRSVLEGAKESDRLPSGKTISEIAQGLDVSESRIAEILNDIRTKQAQRKGLSQERRVMRFSAIAAVLMIVTGAALFLLGFAQGQSRARTSLSPPPSLRNESPSFDLSPEPILSPGTFRVYVGHTTVTVPVTSKESVIAVLDKIDDVVVSNLSPGNQAWQEDLLLDQVRAGDFEGSGIMMASVGYSRTHNGFPKGYKEILLPYYLGSDGRIMSLVHQERERRMAALAS